MGIDPTEGPFFKGFAFLPAGSAHGTIASSLAISFASRVVQEVTRRPRQLMDEPRPCSSTLSIRRITNERWLCEIALGFDTKDG